MSCAAVTPQKNACSGIRSAYARHKPRRSIGADATRTPWNGACRSLPRKRFGLTPDSRAARTANGACASSGGRGLCRRMPTAWRSPQCPADAWLSVPGLFVPTRAVEGGLCCKAAGRDTAVHCVGPSGHSRRFASKPVKWGRNGASELLPECTPDSPGVNSPPNAPNGGGLARTIDDAGRLKAGLRPS